MTVALQPDEIEQRRRSRARRLALYDIPLMRVIGSLFLTLGVYLNNAYLAPAGVALRPWWHVGIALAVYALVSWLAGRGGVFRAARGLPPLLLLRGHLLRAYADL